PGPADPVPGHGWPKRPWDGPEVLADDRRTGARGLEGEDRVALLRPATHVDAVGGGEALRDPEQAVQTHHVIQAHEARVAKDRAGSSHSHHGVARRSQAARNTA